MTMTMNLSIGSSSSNNSSNTTSILRTVGLAYGVAIGTLFAYNVRWKYVVDYLGWIVGRKRQRKSLPCHKVIAPAGSHSKPIIVLLHGMWHDSSWYRPLQTLLQQRGYTSYAIDLLPGNRFLLGFSQREIVEDLEETLIHEVIRDKQDDKSQTKEHLEYILAGHSQGGLVVQSCLLNSTAIESKTKGCALLATYPLGLSPPILKIMKEPRNMYNRIGYFGIALFGKLISVDYLKHIFLLPTTDVNTLSDYTSKLLTAPSDGLVTMSHFPQDVGRISTKPTLVLGAQQDIIYPPHLLSSDFTSRFPNSTHVIVKNQAHCFMDPVSDKSQQTMEDALLNWLDSL